MGTIIIIIIPLHHGYGMYIWYVIIPNRTYMNDNNITISSSSLSVVAVTVAVALPWVHGYGIRQNNNNGLVLYVGFSLG